MIRKLVVVLLALAVAGPLWARGGPRFVVGDGLLGYVSTEVQPTVKCVGGVPTGYPHCSSGTRRIITRGEVQTWTAIGVSAGIAEFLDGPLTFHINCNFNADYRGPCWGTFSWDVPDMGTWEGHVFAPVMDLNTYESELVMFGFGDGGDLDGKTLKLEGSSDPGDWYIAFTARIGR